MCKKGIDVNIQIPIWESRATVVIIGALIIQEKQCAFIYDLC